MTLVPYEPTADQYLADIRKHGDPNYVEDNGMPALCVAIDEYRSASLVEALLRVGANVNQQTSVTQRFPFQNCLHGNLYRGYGRNLSPLHIALVLRQFTIVRLLLDNGADPNTRTSKGNEPLLIVCDFFNEYGSNGTDLDVLKLMVERGADIHVRDCDQRTLLHRAIIAKKHDMARYLISSGCDVNDVDENGETPLHLSRGDTQCAKLLLENHANPNSQNWAGETVYHHVMTSRDSQNNEAYLLQLLHEYDVDPNIRNNQGQTALHLCLKYLYRTNEIVEFILEYGADTRVKDSLGRTPAFYLGSSCSTSSFKHSLGKLSVSTLSKLLNCGINYTRDLNGQPLIHALAKLCLEHGDPLGFECIIVCNAQSNQMDINIRDLQNRTALHFLSAELEWEFAQVLLRHGADIYAMDCDGNTPLHVAVHCKRWQAARMILQWEFSKVDKESTKDDRSVSPTVTSLQRSKSVPDFPWARAKLASRREIDIESFPTPTLSKVISRRINATCLLETCEEHSVGDFHMTAKCVEEKCLVARQVRRLVTDLAERCGELDPRMKCNVLLTGSVAEGTKMWLPDEFDFMMELTELKEQCNLMNPKLPDVTVKEEFRSNWSDFIITDSNSFRLSPKKLKNHINSLLQKAVLGLDKRAYPNLRFNFCSYGTRKDFLQTTKVGVKLLFFWLGEKYKKILISVDLTPAIPLSQQCQVGLQDPVIRMGLDSYFHVIPYVSERHNYDLIWRVSFSLAELKLIRSMSSKQVSLYKCLKFLRDVHMLNVTEVPSYPLKCCIFNFVFEDGYNEDASFNCNVQELLYRLSVHAEEGYYSTRVLRHFFLKDYHLDLTIYDMRWCVAALDFLRRETSTVRFY